MPTWSEDAHDDVAILTRGIPALYVAPAQAERLNRSSLDLYKSLLTNLHASSLSI